MSAKLFLLTVVAALAIVGAEASVSSTKPVMPEDWSANFTILQGGLNYTGWFVYEKSNHRTFKRIPALNESTYVYQSIDQPIMYSYTVLSSGCTCQVTKAGFVPDFFGSYKAASLSKKTCAGGQLYVNDVLLGLAGVPHGSFCVAGDNKPIYYEDTVKEIRYTFTNFKAGVTDGTFPSVALEPYVHQCADACI